MTKTDKLSLLNVDSVEHRLANLEMLIQSAATPPEALPQFANNHIHTTYSFSPYSPAAAIYFAWEAGLQTAGIMDHDSIGGAEEFRRAGEIAGIGTTCGIECRVGLDGTALAGRKLNSPDQSGIAYMAVHSVLPDKLRFVQEVFAPLREQRNVRNRAMVARLNEIIAPLGFLDFERDVLPCSLYSVGGTVTERHLLWALAGQMIETFGAEGLPNVLAKLEISPSAAQTKKFTVDNPNLRYDLLGIFKAHLVARFYIPATVECMHLSELVKIAEEAGAILCYPYLGDVGESVTGDKKREQFEDSFLDELFEAIFQEGVRSVSYMPSRNTAAQIARLRTLCTQYNMIEISGEDINAPGQSFICEKLADPGFKHLVDATWMLIERERVPKSKI